MPFIAKHQFNSVHQQPRRSKRAMLAAIETPLAKSSMPQRNTLDYTDLKGVRRIRLHDTDILTIRVDGSFTIDIGGWNTLTTRARLNEFLPTGYRVFTSKGRANLQCGRYDDPLSRAIPFLQTISVKGTHVKTDMDPQANDRLQKLIDDYMKAWRKRGLPTADKSGGDPWIFTEGKTDENIMLDWLRSKYVFRRLFFMAHKWAGVTEYGQHLYAQYADRRGGKLDKNDCVRIRRYVRACLGLAA